MMMRAAVIDRFGPSDVFRMTSLPVPEPGIDEVLVRVHAAGVNAIDWKTRIGQGVPVPHFPAILGWDISGTVVAAGSAVAGLRPGDHVFGMLRFPNLANAYAQYVTASEHELALKPDNVDHPGAAGAMALLTAWGSLFESAGLKAGQRVLVHDGAGAVGHVAVQLARIAGAEVVATASSRNHELVTGLGASQVIDDTDELGNESSDFDVVLDTKGGWDFLWLLPMLRPGGIIVTLLGDRQGQRHVAAARGLRVGFTHVTPNGARLARIAYLMRHNSLRLTIDGAFPLEKVADAHAACETGNRRGLLVLQPHEPG